MRLVLMTKFTKTFNNVHHATVKQKKRKYDIYPLLLMIGL